MTTINHLKYYLLAVAGTVLVSCSDYTANFTNVADRIALSGDIDGTLTRASDNGFDNGDVIGVYVVNYNGSTAGALKASGNQADNVSHTFSKATSIWTPAYDIYWQDKHTHADIYGYYPFKSSIDDVNDYEFEVQRDQSQASSKAGMDGYEASDFLWGKVTDMAPTANVIRLPMRHSMACAHIMLTEGSGFADGEWASTDKSVLAVNIVSKASIDIATGEVKANGEIESTATVPKNVSDGWKAIVVPQTVKAGTTLFTITVGGIPLKFSRSDDFTYTAGKVSNFTIRVDKKLPGGTYTLTLTDNTITPWEDDVDSYDATARAYIIVNTSRGNLQNAVKNAHLDPAKIKNLKITGTIGDDDYTYIRENMTSLQSLNLKDVTTYGQYNYQRSINKGTIPISALNNLNSLVHIILPDSLKVLGLFSFEMCRSLAGSLYIPDGCTTICEESFCYCPMLNGSLYLPSSLERIEGRAFEGSNFNCELKIPDKVKYIGFRTFADSQYLHGKLKLPDALEQLEEQAFYGCSGLSGDLIIPQKVKEIKRLTFSNCGFDGTLTLHNGITNIGEGAFKGLSHLKGTVTIPRDIIALSSEAFNGCSCIEKIVLPEGLENIGSNAFNGCTAVKTIVCNATTPPLLGIDAFANIDKDNTILEVPQRAIRLYKEAEGWKDFKNIVAISKQ